MVEKLEIIIIVLSIIIIAMIIINLIIGKKLGVALKSRKLLEINEKRMAIELEQSKIENFKFSLNPHSFKNTLSTIEHLAKKTYESVNSLSEIFDYMLYDAKNNFVPLEQEINFVIKYLNLYRLRLKPTVNVKMNIDIEELENWGENKVIAPLIFAHFIENSFKHGDLASSNSFIHIIIETLDENTLIYSVRNRVSVNKTKQKGGLGTNTFKDQLNLLYEKNYQYDFSNENNIYTANLKLTIYDN